MANIDAPFGLRPVRHLNGNPWNGQAEKCYVSSSYATAIYIGDAVAVQTETDYQDTTAKHISVKRVTAGDANPILGVVVSVEPDRSDLTKQYLPASTGGYVYVCMDPDVIFEIRDDGAATPTKLFPMQNAVLIDTHSGSTTTGMSGTELDTNSDPPEADASNQLLILKAVSKEDNDLGANTVWEVLISNHALRCQTGILGVTAT